MKTKIKIKYNTLLIFSGILLIVLFSINIILGSVNIPLQYFLDFIRGHEAQNILWDTIILESRLPIAITATVAGSTLATGGLMMQTLFRNPLADPSILGISSGASLGVAIATMFGGTINFLGAYNINFFQNIIVIISSLIGALIILLLLLALSKKIKSNALLLISGIMIAYITGSMIDILKYNTFKDNVHNFVMWGLGNFSNVTWEQLKYLTSIGLIGLIASLLLIKPLDMLQLGDNYAKNLGLNIKKYRVLIILTTGLMTAIVTAFCGPIAFIGLAVPHIVKLITQKTEHKQLIPLTMIVGAIIALFCSYISKIPLIGGGLPINAITSIIGAPIILFILLKRQNFQYN